MEGIITPDSWLQIASSTDAIPSLRTSGVDKFLLDLFSV
jgi:hypothetical protein